MNEILNIITTSCATKGQKLQHDTLSHCLQVLKDKDDVFWLSVMTQICETVQVIHGKDVCHWDIHAGNILLDVLNGHPHVTIIDFGHSETMSDLREEDRVRRVSRDVCQVARLMQKIIGHMSVKPRDIEVWCTNTLINTFMRNYEASLDVPLKALLRRNFLILNLDDIITKCLKSCYRCAATRDEKHVKVPMSSVEPPDSF